MELKHQTEAQEGIEKLWGLQKGAEGQGDKVKGSQKGLRKLEDFAGSS